MAPRPPTNLTRKPTHAPSSLSLSPKHNKPPRPPTKRTKRTSKHTLLLSRLTTTTAPPSKITKRRRPSKKLVTNLDSLTDALPALTTYATDNADAMWEGIKDADAKDNIPALGMGMGKGKGKIKHDASAETTLRIKHQSLKSRPGALRKKEKLVAMERERFARNLARMCAGCASSSSSSSCGNGRVEDGEMDVEGGDGGGKEEVRSGGAERWAAIRGFISQTMERRVDGGGVVGMGGGEGSEMKGRGRGNKEGWAT